MQVPVERVLQICMAMLASLATLLLGMGERTLVLPLAAVAVAFSSVYFCDVRRWIYLNTSAANLGGLASFVACAWEYRTGRAEENQLLALANLLIYLQCVLFYQEKTPRIYWMLALLSLLQVAVATVLNLSFWFGVLMVVFMLLAMGTLVLFLLYREQQHYGASTNGKAFTPRTSPPLPWTDIRRGVLRQVGRMATVTLALSVVVFVVVPRTGGTNWGETMANETQHIVGYDDSVTLGELGEILESPEEVLQVRFFDVDTEEPYYLNDVPLIRGSVLTRYHNGHWSPDLQMTSMSIPAPTAGHRGLVRQEFKVSRLQTSTLFAIYPLLRKRDKEGIRLTYDAQNDRLIRGAGPYTYPLNYTLFTSGLRDGQQLPITPCLLEPHPHEMHFHLLQRVDDERFSTLKKLAAEMVRSRPATDVVGRAQLLERYLRDAGGFRYTLSPPRRDPNLDPIEDFIRNNRAGHCEYFASALTLMLRSVDIPARMAVGFKGADWNPLTGYYHVRQMYAHTWVEVYLHRGRPANAESEEPSIAEQIPAGTIEALADQIPAKDWENGAWLRLDPTPAAFEGADEMPPTSLFPSLRHMMDYADYLWAGYVLSMDARRQRETFFEPLKAGTEGFVAVLFNRERWEMTLRNIGKLLRGERLDDAGLWFSWRAAVLSFILLTTLVFLYRGIAWIVRRVFHIARPQQMHRGSLKDAEVEFYRRLEAMLAQRNLMRTAAQTQREFALRVGDELATDPRTIQVATIPRRIAELFYRVRFGRERLDQEHLESVERGLTELSAAFSEPAAT